MNITICGYVNLKNTIEEFQEGDEINQILKKQKKTGINIVHEKFKSQSKSNNNHSFWFLTDLNAARCDNIWAPTFVANIFIKNVVGSILYTV